MFVVVANMVGCGNPKPGLSGGDRILIELIRSWSLQGHNVKIFTGKSGYLMLNRYINGKNIEFKKTSKILLRKRDIINLFFFVFCIFINGCLTALKLRENRSKRTIIYSASDFWPDSIPALIMKLKYKNAHWIAGFYLFTPNPFYRSVYHGRSFVYGLLYFLSQKPIYSLVKRFSDMTFVTNEMDRWNFINNTRFSSSRVLAIKGGIDLKFLSKVKFKRRPKKFDAIFIGRLTAWKGLLELLDIWKDVCTIRKNAKLAIVGSGELTKSIVIKIKILGLGKNVFLFGFKDGVEKVELIKESKIVVHPSIFDSGGMAACEAMACGLPGVSYDLESLESYYPKGMVKTPKYNQKKFAQNILDLLENKELYEMVSKEARELAGEWDWQKRTEKVSMAIEALISSKC